VHNPTVYLKDKIQNSKELQRPSVLRYFESVYFGILRLFFSVDDLSTACHSSMFWPAVISLYKYSTLHRETGSMTVATLSILADFATLHVRPKTAAYLHNS
jgi:hypothetical protein